jgi:hypothetical protein
MKLLVSTTETQGARSNDFCFVPDGELLNFSFECATDRGNPDGSCGCSRSMCGFKCKTGTTTFKVAEVKITHDELMAKIREGYPTLKLSVASCRKEVRALIGLAAPFEIGEILEKRERGLQVRKLSTKEQWITAVLSNDEASSDDELRAYFIANGVSAADADLWLTKRDDYLRGLIR